MSSDKQRGTADGPGKVFDRAAHEADAIRKLTILPADWAEDGGQLTPGLKLKRSVVVRESREAIEALYLA